MERIQQQPSEYSSLAKRALLWVLYAKEPLTMDQLRGAVALTSLDISHPPEPLADVQILLSSCCGLLENEESGVRLVRRSNDLPFAFWP
jgi:ankyrin repeat domain-containing protein 50